VPLKFGICSDIDLEYKFKHMTSKLALKYEEDQLKNFDKLIEKCIENRIDLLLIVGNLFGTYRPKNKIIDKVMEGFQRLKENEIFIFILPGSHDTPLCFSEDKYIHTIFTDNNFIYNLLNVIHNEESKNIIKEPLYKGNIKGERIQIFAPLNPLIKPYNFQYELKTEENYINIFLLPNILDFKKDTEKIFKKTLDLLKNQNLDILISGGYKPLNIPINNFNFQIIHSPQVHQNNFNNWNVPHGILITELNSRKFQNFSNYIQISHFKMIKKIFTIENYPMNEINEEIINFIKDNANVNSIFMKLIIQGNIKKSDYHKIKLYQFLEIGKLHNYYFELQDNILFTDSSTNAQSISIISEIENLTNRIIQEEKPVEGEIKYYNYAIEKIKKDWENLGNIQ